jgi:hypothetical protein
MENNLIKVLLKSECPHCLGEIFIEVESPAPIVKGVLKLTDIASAKEYVTNKLKEALKNEEMDQEDFDSAVEWLNSEDTIFGPKDVESIVASVINTPNK